MVVTDGFTGNVALKTGEGAVKLIGELLREVFRTSTFAKIGYLLPRGALDSCASGSTRAATTAAVILGLNGVW